MESFVTGSRVYGTPTADSDLDLVIRASPELKEQLESNYGRPIRIGNLNLIVATSNNDYNAWQAAKEKCLKAKKFAGRPLTKKESIDVHDAVRYEYSSSYNGESGKLYALIGDIVRDAKAEAKGRKALK